MESKEHKVECCHCHKMMVVADDPKSAKVSHMVCAMKAAKPARDHLEEMMKKYPR